jgi:hypothetical protein
LIHPGEHRLFGTTLGEAPPVSLKAREWRQDARGGVAELPIRRILVIGWSGFVDSVEGLHA